jgi:hypothetical protein
MATTTPEPLYVLHLLRNTRRAIEERLHTASDQEMRVWIEETLRIANSLQSGLDRRNCQRLVRGYPGWPDQGNKQ